MGHPPLVSTRAILAEREIPSGPQIVDRRGRRIALIALIVLILISIIVSVVVLELAQ